MAESSRRYNLRDTRKKPVGVLLKRWEVEYSNLISNENRRIPLEKVKTAICSAFEDGMFQQWRITLKCPLSRQRIKVPARYANCTHIECFDLEPFLRMKTQKNLQVCPICQKEVEKPLANLRIDKYIETVLSTMPDAIQVELQSDGSFSEIHEDLVIVPNVIIDEEPFVQDTSFDVKQEALEDDDEYMTLSDGEDGSTEEVEIVEMKPISLMPLNVDVKPKITLSSEPEQIHSGEDQEIQDQHNAAMQKANISRKKRNVSGDENDKSETTTNENEMENEEPMKEKNVKKKSKRARPGKRERARQARERGGFRGGRGVGFNSGGSSYGTPGWGVRGGFGSRGRGGGRGVGNYNGGYGSGGRGGYDRQGRGFGDRWRGGFGDRRGGRGGFGERGGRGGGQLTINLTINL